MTAEELVPARMATARRRAACAGQGRGDRELTELLLLPPGVGDSLSVKAERTRGCQRRLASDRFIEILHFNQIRILSEF